MTASTFSHINNFHLPYLAEFKRLGWEVHVACGGEESQVPFTDKSFRVPILKSYTSFSNVMACIALRRLMKREHYDLVITHTSLAAFFTRLAEAGIRPHPKTVNVVHGYLFDDSTPWLKAAVLKTAELILAPLTDVVVTMNGYDAKWAASHKVAKALKHIPGVGVDADKLLAGKPVSFGFPESDYVMIYPAEFSERKNQEILIRAMAELPERIRLVLPGIGPRLDECRILAEKYGVKSRVLFPGYVDDIGSCLRAADVAVSSSRSEGLPFNIVEAMLCSLPVIASRVKGNSDLVDDGATGFLFSPDDIDSFKKSVIYLYCARDIAEKMGAAGKEKAEKYTLKSVFRKLMEIYLADT